MAARRYYSSWILNYATMFEASLTAFVVGSTFLNRAHFDLFYHFVSLVMVFGHPTAAELAGKDIIVAHNSYLQIWAEVRYAYEELGVRCFWARPMAACRSGSIP